MLSRQISITTGLGVAAAAVMFAVNAADASMITYTGTQGNLAASATFEANGTDLVITFSNISGADVVAPNEILAAVFFDISGPLVTLTPNSGSVVLGPGSTVLFGGSDPGGVVGGEWAYASGLAGGSPNGANYGVSASGFDLFGAANFPGSNLQGPVSVDGLQYGLTSAGDNPLTGNAAVTGGHALIQNSVVITLPGLPFGFDPAASISNVFFQYGTDFKEPGFPGIPEPATLALLLLSGMVGRARRRR